MLTPSVNVVQSSFPEKLQGDFRAVPERVQSGVLARRREPAPYGESLVRNRTGNPRRHQFHRGRRLAPGAPRTPKGPYQWQDWSFDWAAADIGRHTIRARATDAAGNVQPEVPPWNRLGYGNNAIEVPYVDVTPE